MKKKKKADKKSDVSDTANDHLTSRTSKEDLKTNEDLTCFKFLIFILSFAAYSSTCYRSFPGGDSTELIGNVSEKIA